jgi:excisionase family DNA binding protein
MSTSLIDEDEDARLLRVFGARLAVSVQRAADALDCGVSYVYRLIDAGELPSHLLAGRRKIDVKDIMTLYARKRAAPAPMRTMPWDQNGIAPRQYWPRRDDAPDSPKRIKARAEAAEVRRGPGRPRKDASTQPQRSKRR